MTALTVRLGFVRFYQPHNIPNSGLDFVPISFFSSYMKLSEALTKSIKLKCERCTAEQPAYVHHWIEELGADALMKDALKTAACFFCKSKGDLLILHMGT